MEHSPETLPAGHPPKPRGLAPGFGLGSRLPPSCCPSSLPEAGAAAAAGAGAAASPRCCLRRCKRGGYPGATGLGLPSPGLGCSCRPAAAGSWGKPRELGEQQGCVWERARAGMLLPPLEVPWLAGGTTLPAPGSR